MAFRKTPKLIFPLGSYTSISLPFMHRTAYSGTYWGFHLGTDLDAVVDTEVFAIGRGVVVYSKLHPGEFSPEGEIAKRNWGGIVIIAHKHPNAKKVFYSLYGHLGKRYVKKGDAVEMGQVIGAIGKSLTESNGLWEQEHLHFAIYGGVFKSGVLPGYYNEEEKNTNPEDWADPVEFIKKYNLA
jgi:murein DD-endopeptidase MepM/ murein hydrolase activator NlpD